MNRSPVILVMVVTTLFVLSIGVTWVIAQDGDVEYFACVNNSSGIMHMVDEGESCAQNEHLAHWSQSGSSLPALPPPDLDTGWISCDNVWYSFDLTADDVLVDMYFRDLRQDPDPGNPLGARILSESYPHPWAVWEFIPLQDTLRTWCSNSAGFPLNNDITDADAYLYRVRAWVVPST